MQEQEKDFNPQASLKLIEGMIHQAKSRFAENGFLYLLWGWVVFGCAIVAYTLLKLGVPVGKASHVWWLTIVATVIQIVYLAKQKKKPIKVVTYSNDVINNLWMVYGITMCVFMVLVVRLNMWPYVHAIVLIFYGIPTFLSGVVMRFNPLKWGAVGCWFMAIAATYASEQEYLVVLAIAVLSAWIIPGHLLQQKFKKENTHNG